MSLSIKEKDAIRKLRRGWLYAIDEKGKALYPKKKEEKPNYDVGEIRKQICDDLRQMGYTVYVGNPRAANCIIRVYRSESRHDNQKYRIMGAQCYTKAQEGKWKTVDIQGNEFGIDFAQHVIRTWFFQDESWEVPVDFFDTYVKLVKEK